MEGQEQSSLPVIHTMSSFPFNKGIAGIGHYLGQEDIDKRMVRTMPMNGYDWSRAGRADNPYWTRHEAVIIIGIDDDYIHFINTVDTGLGKRKMKKTEGWNDNNWISEDEYIKWIENNPLENFKQVIMDEADHQLPYDVLKKFAIMTEAIHQARQKLNIGLDIESDTQRKKFMNELNERGGSVSQQDISDFCNKIT